MMTPSETLLQLYQTFLEAKTPEERTEILLHIAEEAESERDPSDLDLDEESHSFYEELNEARFKYQQAAMRLGRVVIQSLEVLSNQKEDDSIN